jgi:hypothetical protein
LNKKIERLKKSFSHIFTNTPVTLSYTDCIAEKEIRRSKGIAVKIADLWK